MKLTRQQHNRRPVRHSLSVWACASGFCVAMLVVAQAGDVHAEFTSRPYVGIGAGVTQLNPRTPNSSLTVSEKTDSGYHVVAGYDFTSRLSAEVYYADLGAAEIAFLGTDVGGIDYQVYGLSGIAYLFNNRSGFSANPSTSGMGTREGLSLYARAGIGAVSADSELDYKVDHAAHLALGLGAEYGFKNGFAVRGEYKALDTDQQYASVSVLKRFGKVSSGLAAVVPATVVADLAPPADVPADTPAAPDFSEIPSTYFAFDQSEITPAAATQLDEVVKLLGSTNKNIAVEGHTDWTASEQYNEALSLRRAESVQRYLESKGISRSQIVVRGYGETRPIASNGTAEGRAKNRRVDIRVN